MVSFLELPPVIEMTPTYHIRETKKLTKITRFFQPYRPKKKNRRGKRGQKHKIKSQTHLPQKETRKKM